MPFVALSHKSIAAFLEFKVAGYTIDSLGRRWDASKHPRDSRGRFIETGGVARVGLGGLGTVIRSMAGGKIEVQMHADGSHKIVPHQQLTMVRRPDGTSPTKSVKKVATEDARREADPTRGDGKFDADPGDDKPFDGVENDVLANVDASDDDYEADNPDDSDEDDDDAKGAPEAYTPSRESGQQGDPIVLTRRDKDGEPVHVLGKIDAVGEDGRPSVVSLAGPKNRRVDLEKFKVDDYTVVPFEDVEDVNALLNDAVNDNDEPAFLDNELATDLVEGHAKKNKVRPSAAVRPKGTEGGGTVERQTFTAEDYRYANVARGEDRNTIYDAHNRPVGTIERIPHRDPKKAAQGENMYVVTDAYNRKVKRPASDSDTALEQLAKQNSNPPADKQPKVKPVNATTPAPAAPAAPAPAPERVDTEVQKIAANQSKATEKVVINERHGTTGTRTKSGNLVAVKQGGVYSIYRKTDHENTGGEDRISFGGQDYTIAGTARTIKDFRESWAGTERDVPAVAYDNSERTSTSGTLTAKGDGRGVGGFDVYDSENRRIGGMRQHSDGTVQGFMRGNSGALQGTSTQDVLDQIAAAHDRDPIEARPGFEGAMAREERDAANAPQAPVAPAAPEAQERVLPGIPADPVERRDRTQPIYNGLADYRDLIDVQTGERISDLSLVANNAKQNVEDEAVSLGYATRNERGDLIPADGVHELDLETWVDLNASDQYIGLLDGYGYDRDGNVRPEWQAELDKRNADTDAAAAPAPTAAAAETREQVTARIPDAEPAERPSETSETTYPENTTPNGATDESVRQPGGEVLGDVPAERPAADSAGEPSRVLRGDRDRSGADDRVADEVEPAVEQPRGGQPEAGRAPRRNGASQGRGGDAGRAGVPAEGARDRGQDDAELGGDGARGGDRGGVAPAGQDFQPTTQDDLAPKGVDDKLAANMAALRLLRQLEADGATTATPEQQATLAKFSGWGSLPRVFNLGDSKYATERDELRELLGDEEYESALDNALNAHYTDAKFVKPMWDLMERLGFAGGDVLEAGSGTGNFIGFAPDGARMKGVEKNDVTAGIAKYLYPSAEIRNESFGDTDVAPNEFDAMIGNVPFGNFPVFDSVDNPGNYFNIHDHFMLKGARGLKPGGVMAVVTSAGTMDKQNAVARKKLDEMGMELIGAVRLPNGAHQDAAGTTVLTDMLVLRKRKDGEPEGDKSWLTSEDMQLDDGTTLPMNAYYAKHPENVLGETRSDTSRFSSNDVVGVKGDLANLESKMTEAMDRIAAEAIAAGKTHSPEGEKGTAPTRKTTRRGARKPAAAKATTDAPAAPKAAVSKDGVYTSPRTQARAQSKIVGQITHTAAKKSGKGVTHEFTMVDFDGTEKSYSPPKTQAEELAALLRLRDIAADLREAEGESMVDTDEMGELRAELNRVYDDYVAKFGPIGRMKRSRTKVTVKDETDENETEGLFQDDDGTWYRNTFIKPPMGGIRKDATWWSVTGLESEYDEATSPGNPHGTAKKAAIFTKRTIGFRSLPTKADNPRDAIALSREYDDRIDMDRIADLLGVSKEEAVEQTKGLIYEDHETGELVDARQYLAGNVRKKAAELEALAAQDPKWTEQARAMRAVVPADKKATDITARLGMAWIPESDMQAFLRDLTNNQSATLKKDGEKGWQTSPVASPYNRYPNREGGSGMQRPPGHTGVLVAQWGTERRTTYQLVESLLKGQRPVVKDKDEEKREYINVAETEAAQAMADKLAAEFDAWWKRDGERRDRLTKVYNELYRSHTDVNYVDSPYAEYVGMSDGIELDPHQNDAVAMSKDLPTVMLAHEVGVGKTFTMVAAVMEKKRLGQVEKPVIVVPNHLLEQFVREFKVLYPNANLLAGDSNSVKDVNDRRRFAAQAGSHDWDAVIMTKNSFRYLPLSEATTVENDEAKIAELRAKRDDLLMEKGETKTVKTMGEQIARLEAKLEELRARIGGDIGAIDFENVGFDYVVVDEAHEYKNDLIESAERSLQNLKPNLFALDLREKLDWLRETNPERGRNSIAMFATGTPVSNSTREFYVMMRFLRPDLLREGHIESFDDFRAAYLQTEESVEQDVAGRTKVKVREGDALINAGELKRLWVQFADEVTADDIGLTRPKLKNGQGTKRVVRASEPLRKFMAHLAYRQSMIRPSFKPEKGEDTHVAIGTDGLTAAVDLRLLPREKVEAAGIDYDALTIHDGKLGVIGDDVLEEWNRTKDMTFKVKRDLDEDAPVKGAAQIVFLDKGVPGGAAPIGAYDELKKYLVAGGMKPEEVAFIHDAEGDPLKMGKLSEKVRTGEIKVLIGSTPKMGTGLNVQNRLSMLHHADGAYRPDQIEQRNGRIIRRGNQFDEVEVRYYPVEGSNEGFQWAHVARKDNFLRQFAEADLDATIVGTLESDIPSEADTIAALGSEDPLVMEETTLKLALRKQKAAFTSWQSAQDYHSNNVTQNRLKAERIGEARDKVAAAAEHVTSTAGDDFGMSIGENSYTRPVPYSDRAAALEALSTWKDSLNLQYAPNGDGPAQAIGQLGGMNLYGWTHKDWTGKVSIRFGVAEVDPNAPTWRTPNMLDLPRVEVSSAFNPGTITRLENMVAGITDRPAALQAVIDKATQEAEESAREVGGEFAEKAELDALETRHAALRDLMRTEDATQVPALKALYESATQRWEALKAERLASGDQVKPKEMGEARTSRRKVKGERKAAERVQTGEAAPTPRKRRTQNATEDTDGSAKIVTGKARERGPRPDGGQGQRPSRPAGPSSDTPSKPAKKESSDPVALDEEIAETLAAADAETTDAGDAPRTREEQVALDLADPDSDDVEADVEAMVAVHAANAAPTSENAPKGTKLTPADDEPAEDDEPSMTITPDGDVVDDGETMTVAPEDVEQAPGLDETGDEQDDLPAFGDKVQLADGRVVTWDADSFAGMTAFDADGNRIDLTMDEVIGWKKADPTNLAGDDTLAGTDDVERVTPTRAPRAPRGEQADVAEGDGSEQDAATFTDVESNPGAPTIMDGIRETEAEQAEAPAADAPAPNGPNGGYLAPATMDTIKVGDVIAGTDGNWYRVTSDPKPQFFNGVSVNTELVDPDVNALPHNKPGFNLGRNRMVEFREPHASTMSEDDYNAATTTVADVKVGDRVMFRGAPATVTGKKDEKNTAWTITLDTADGERSVPVVASDRITLASAEDEQDDTMTVAPEDLPSTEDLDPYEEANAETADADKIGETSYAPAPSTPEQERHEADADYEPLTPTQLDGEKYPLNSQQQRIADTVVAERKDTTLVRAKAGTGKTSTLEAIARRFQELAPKERVLYIAFNKSVQTEAEGRMPGNVESRTGHSLAWGWLPKTFVDKKLGRGKAKPTNTMLRNDQKVADYLGLKSDMATTDEGTKLAPRRIASLALKAVDRFAYSADDKIGEQHFTDLEGKDTIANLSPINRRLITGLAERIWKDIQDEDGQIKLTPDHYRKMWALSKPDLTKTTHGNKTAASVLFLDEAQDTPPVLAKVVSDQKMQKVIVGDADQQIYSFTGAIDYLNQVDSDADLPLDTSYRFGPTVANIANRFLQVLGSDERVVGGGSTRGEIVPEMDDADAILTRSNAGLLTEAQRELANGRKVAVTKGVKDDLLNFVETAKYLKGEGAAPTRMHEDLASYESWEQVEEAIAEDGDPRLVMLDNLIEKFGLDGLKGLIEQVTELSDQPATPQTGSDDDTVGATGLLAKVKATLEGDKLTLSGGTYPVNEALLKDTERNLRQFGFEYDGTSKTWSITGTPEERDAALARLREQFRTTAPAGADTVLEPEYDVVVSTAHKSKGLEWDRVRIAGDFRGPKEDEATGEIKMPSDEELKLAYVAVTRAGEALDPGSLGWVYDYSNDNGAVTDDAPEADAPEETVTLTAEDLERDDVTVPDVADVADQPADVIEDALSDEDEDDEDGWGDDEEEDADAEQSHMARRRAEMEPLMPEPKDGVTRSLRRYTWKYQGDDPTKLPLDDRKVKPTEPREYDDSWEVPEGYEEVPFTSLRAGDIVREWGNDHDPERDEYVFSTWVDPEGEFHVMSKATMKWERGGEFGYSMHTDGAEVPRVVRSTDTQRSEAEAAEFAKARKKRGDVQEPGSAPELKMPAGLDAVHSIAVRGDELRPGMRVRIHTHKGMSDKPQVRSGIVGDEFTADIDTEYGNRTTTRSFKFDVVDEKGKRIGFAYASKNTLVAVSPEDTDAEDELPQYEALRNERMGLTESEHEESRDDDRDRDRNEAGAGTGDGDGGVVPPYVPTGDDDENDDEDEPVAGETPEQAEERRKRKRDSRRRYDPQPSPDPDANAGGAGAPTPLAPLGLGELPLHGDPDASGSGSAAGGSDSGSDEDRRLPDGRRLGDLTTEELGEALNTNMRDMQAAMNAGDFEETERLGDLGDAIYRVAERRREDSVLAQTEAANNGRVNEWTDLADIRPGDTVADYSRRGVEVTSIEDVTDANGNPAKRITGMGYRGEGDDLTFEQVSFDWPADRRIMLARRGDRPADTPEATPATPAAPTAPQAPARAEGESYTDEEWNGGNPSNLSPLGTIPVSKGLSEELAYYLENGQQDGRDQGYTLSPNGKTMLVHDKERAASALDAIEDIKANQASDGDRGALSMSKAAGARKRMVNQLPDRQQAATGEQAAPEQGGPEVQHGAFGKINPEDLTVGDRVTGTLASTGEPGELRVESVNPAGYMTRITGIRPDGTRDYINVPSGHQTELIGRALAGDLEKAWERPLEDMGPQVSPNGEPVMDTVDNLGRGDVIEAGYKGRRGNWVVESVEGKSGMFTHVMARPKGRPDDRPTRLSIKTDRPVKVMERAPESPEMVADREREQAEYDALPEADKAMIESLLTEGPTLSREEAEAQVAGGDADAPAADAADADEVEDYRPELLADGTLANPLDLDAPTDEDGNYSPAQLRFLADEGAEVLVNVDGSDEWLPGIFERVRPDGTAVFRWSGMSDTDHGGRHEWPSESIAGIRGASRLRTLAEEVDPSVLRPGTEVAVMGKSDKGTYRGVLEGVTDDGRAIVRMPNGEVRNGAKGGTVRPVLTGFRPGEEPTAAERLLAPKPGVWTANDDSLVAGVPGEWVAGIRPTDEGYEWSLIGFDGALPSQLANGNVGTVEQAKSDLTDAFYNLGMAGRAFTTLPGDNETDRDDRSRGFAADLADFNGTSETTGSASDGAPEAAEAPADVDGATAEWVPTGEIAPGDVVRVDGDNGNGSATTRTGHALGTPEPVTVGNGAGMPDKGLVTTIGDDTDGLGDRETILSPDASLAARAGRTGEEVGENPQSAYESQILSDNVGSTMPTDRNGLGIFPGSTVVDGDRRGNVLSVWDRDVEVRWAAGEDSERIAPGHLTVHPDMQARPAGWTPQGQKLEAGHMVGVGDEMGVVQSVTGDEAQVQVGDNVRTIGAGELQVLGKVSDATANPAAAPAYDVPPSIEGPDVRQVAPVMPTDLPEGAQADRVVLKPEHRAAFEALGLDTDSVTPMEVQEAAARVRHDMPITADQAADLAAYIAAIAGADSRPPASKRQLQRVINRLVATVNRINGGEGIGTREAPTAAQQVKVSDLTRGDMVAIPNPATGELEVGAIAGMWPVQNGQVFDTVLALPDGTTRRHALLPDGEAFLLPDLDTDLGSLEADEDVTVKFIEPQVADRAAEAATITVEAAIGDAEGATSIEDLGEKVLDGLDSDKAGRDQRNSGRRNKASMERSGLEPEQVAQGREAAEKAADEVAEQVAETIVNTIEDAEPLPGETPAEAADRVRDLLRDADADVELDKVVADAMTDRADAPTRQEQAKARREVADALRADLFAMADQLAELGDTDSANALSEVAAKLAGKPDERHVEAAAQAVAMGRPGVAARMKARIRGMFARARAAFAARVAAIHATMDRAKRSMRAAVMAARAEWNGTPEVSQVLAEAVEKITTPDVAAAEPVEFTERVAHWRDQLPGDSSMLGKTDTPSRGFRGLTLARLRAGDTVAAEDLTGARVDRAADGGPGETAMAHYEALRGLGAAMDDEVNARVRGLAPELGEDPAGTVRDALLYLNDAMEAVRIGGDDPELIALERKALDDAVDKQQAYVNARSKATRDALAQVRSMGPQGAVGLNVQGRSEDAPEVQALNWAEQFIPTEWLAKAGTVEAQAGRMGSYGDGTITVAPLGAGMVEGSGQYGASALRGLAHHLEATVPGIATASWMHQWAQTSTGKPGARQRRGKNALAWLRDVFPAAGFSDEDGTARWAWDAMESDGVDHYQWLGSGLEGLFGDAMKDDDLRQWMLGLLAYLARKG